MPYKFYILNENVINWCKFIEHIDKNDIMK